MVAWKRPSGGGGSTSTVMMDRLRSSGGVSLGVANPLGPTGRARVPSHDGAALAFPMRVGLGALVGTAARWATATPEHPARALPRQTTATSRPATRAAPRDTVKSTRLREDHTPAVRELPRERTVRARRLRVGYVSTGGGGVSRRRYVAR